MAMMDFGVRFSSDQHCPKINTIELKHLILRRLGQQKSEKYFDLLNRYLHFHLTKSAFDKMCIHLLGTENLRLHNGLIRAIIKNACLNARKLSGNKSCIQLHPIEPHDEDSVQKFPEHDQTPAEILSLGSRPPSVEDGEEVEQDTGSPGIHSRTFLRAPLGIRFRLTKGFCSRSLRSSDTCYYNAELPDTGSLRKRLERNLRMNVKTDCVDLLNNGVDVFLKRLLKSCLDLASLKCEREFPSKVHRKFQISMTDFHVVVQSNPRVLGEDWPIYLEKVFLSWEDHTDG